MAKVIVPIKFTYQDYLLLPEDKRYELIEGELIMVPSPTTPHQAISRNLFMLINNFVTRRKLGEVFYAPLDVVLSDEDVVQPDIIYISKKRLKIVTEKNVQGPPDLVIEILSESTKEKDRIIKRKLYAKYGVREYWIVDPDAETIEVLTLGDRGLETYRVFTKGVKLRSPLLKGLTINLKRIFEG